MPDGSKLLPRVVAMLMAILAFGVTDAVAQSQNCRVLANNLNQIERNGDFRASQDSQSNARDLRDAVQEAESVYVRAGCNAMAKRGQTLTSQCRGMARDVLSARADYAKVSKQMDTGDAIAQQREAVLQQMARFNCDDRSNASVTESSRGNLFQQLFDAFGGRFDDGAGGTRDEGQFQGYGNYETVRTVCVRKSDGYYWPISYSTLKDYAPNDLTQCQEQCPGMDVDLYYYDNPGQEPDQMISLTGEPYTSLPSAFAYRKSYDRANSCKTPVNYGSISLAALPDGSNRPVISYGEETFPLPIHDPRQVSAVTEAPLQTAEYVQIPLPRPRPPAPGEAPVPVAVTTAAANSQTLRIVQFGDKRVRIVGPDTPYAPTAATGT